jgi:hypothetical protein
MNIGVSQALAPRYARPAAGFASSHPCKPEGHGFLSPQPCYVDRGRKASVCPGRSKGLPVNDVIAAPTHRGFFIRVHAGGTSPDAKPFPLANTLPSHHKAAGLLRVTSFRCPRLYWSFPRHGINDFIAPCCAAMPFLVSLATVRLR